MDDLNQITDVMRARGLELNKGRFLVRVKNLVLLLLPLLTNSLERAIQVSEAMEARAFGMNEKRSYYKEIRFNKLDGFVGVLIGLFFIGEVIIRYFGFGIFILSPGFIWITPGIIDYSISLFLFFGGFLLIYFLKESQIENKKPSVKSNENQNKGAKI
jgi:energy-coupling factor transport system permease protein